MALLDASLVLAKIRFQIWLCQLFGSWLGLLTNGA